MIASVDDTGDSDTGLTLADIDNGIRDGLSDLEKPQFETCLGEAAKYGQPQAAGCYMLFGYRFGDGGEVARDQAAAEAQSQVFHGIGMASAAMAVPFKNGAWAKSSDVLTSAEQWLGRGYMEVEPGRFVSVDGTRQFRITSGDLTGHGGKQPPHANFETLVPNPAKSGKMMIDSNTHVYFFDP